MNEEYDRVQLTIEQAEKRVEKAKKWEQLLSNPLFDELITKDYLGDDAVRLTMNLKPKTEDNNITSNLLLAKAAFSRFVAQVLDEGRNAQAALEENAQLLQELDSE